MPGKKFTSAHSVGGLVESSDPLLKNASETINTQNFISGISLRLETYTMSQNKLLDFSFSNIIDQKIIDAVLISIVKKTNIF